MELRARTDLQIALRGEAGIEYMMNGIHFSLKNNLVSNDGKFTMTFVRNSQAYNIDYTLVNSNTPRWWPLGTL